MWLLYRSSNRSDGQTACELNIQNTLSDIDRVAGVLQDPVLSRHIPHRKVSPGQVEVEVHSLTRIDTLLVEAAELLRRSAWNANVQLRDLGRANGARVGDLDIDVGDDIPERRVASLLGRRVRWQARVADVGQNVGAQGGVVEGLVFGVNIDHAAGRAVDLLTV